MGENTAEGAAGPGCAESVVMPGLTYRRTRRFFLSCLGLLYLTAFSSLWVQVQGLYGSSGILPIAGHLQALASRFGAAALRAYPSLFWLWSGDWALTLACACGVLLSLLLLFGYARRAACVGLWLLYLSFVTVGQVFLDYQWDALLLEMGFVAVFFAPGGWGREDSGRVPRVFLWLLRLLLLRVLLSIGLGQVMSVDPAWTDLSVLDYLFSTQPLPGWVGWYARLLPGWLSETALTATVATQIVVTLFVFGPRVTRLIAWFCIVACQILILGFGNLAFFGPAVLTLSVTLLDDRAVDYLSGRRRRRRWAALVSQWWERRGQVTEGGDDDPEAADGSRDSSDAGGDDGGQGGEESGQPASSTYADDVRAKRGKEILWEPRWVENPEPRLEPQIIQMLEGDDADGDGDEEREFDDEREDGASAVWTVGNIAAGLLAAVLISNGLTQSLSRLGYRSMPAPLLGLVELSRPFHLTSGYGLFTTVLKRRREIILEGSADGKTWKAYMFAYKPGDTGRAPVFVQPHQPRIDWQMWVAATADYRSQHWLSALQRRLLEASPAVLSLFAQDPFNGRRPRMVRAVLYDYRFSSLEEYKADGQWWKRRQIGAYSPALYLPPGAGQAETPPGSDGVE